MSNHDPHSIQDDVPFHPGAAQPAPVQGHAGHHQPRPPGPDDQPPPVDPQALEDYSATLTGFREDQAVVEATTDGAAAPIIVVLPLPDGSDARYTVRDPRDESVRSYLEALAMFAETDVQQAQAVFEALLGPEQYADMGRRIKPVLRDVVRRSAVDPTAPTVADVWKQLADGIMAPIRALAEQNPKGSGSPGGQSPTGNGSGTNAGPSGLPTRTS